MIEQTQTKSIRIMALALTGLVVAITWIKFQPTIDDRLERPVLEEPHDAETESIEETESVLTLKVTGIKKKNGTLMVAAFADGQGYPDHEQATHVQSFKVDTNDDSYTLVGLPPGNYAIAVYHDVDNNRQLNRALVGYPTEPYGFSNNARETFGPPDYTKAEFEAVIGQQTVPIQIR
ncbi:MAG: DUF2141 domain-containing protein [Pirellulaceae bacterium]|nr:DUF2141 domain-containing protein [Pirellulaceae bacterium]